MAAIKGATDGRTDGRTDGGGAGEALCTFRRRSEARRGDDKIYAGSVRRGGAAENESSLARLARSLSRSSLTTREHWLSLISVGGQLGESDRSSKVRRDDSKCMQA